MVCILIQELILLNFPVSFKICQFHRMGRYLFCDVAPLFPTVLFIIQCDQERNTSFKILSAVAKWYAVQSSSASVLYPVFTRTVKNDVYNSCKMGFHGPSWLFAHTVAVKEWLSVLNFMPEFHILKTALSVFQKMEIIVYFVCLRISYSFVSMSFSADLYVKRKYPWWHRTISF